MNNELTLPQLLADIYGSDRDVIRLLDQIGVKSSMFDLDGSIYLVWSEVLRKLLHMNGRLPSLIIAVHEEYQNGKQLIALYTKWVTDHNAETKKESIINSSGTIGLSILQQDVRELRRDIDELNIRTTIELSKLDHDIALVSQKLDDLSTDLQIKRAPDDRRNTRVLIYALLISSVFFILMMILGGIGGIL